jgi:endonuclease/exonuclease/phosphatase (EEP) superfamily protein YafD
LTAFRRPPASRVKAVVAWTAAIPCALWAFIRVFGLEAGFPLTPVFAYTVYVIPFAVLAAIVAAILRQWVPAALAGIAALALILAVAPRVVGGPDDVEGRPLRVMAANVLRGSGDPAQLVELARDREVEILAIQEFTPKFQRAFEDAGARELFPHAALAVREGVIGSAVYSRHPIEPGPEGEYVTQNRGTVEIEPGVKVAVLSAHPTLPSTPGNVKDWKAGLRAMPEPNAEGSIWLLLGDFNATLDHDEFRDLLGRGYADAGERMGDGLEPTWPAQRTKGRYLPVTIDHVLYEDDRVGVRDYDVLELEGSDHRPVYAELVIRD